MQKELDMLIEHLPGYRQKVIELYHTNEQFKMLCDDYWQCRSVLQKCSNNISADSMTEKEYLLLCQDLERDALRLLRNK